MPVIAHSPTALSTLRHGPLPLSSLSPKGSIRHAHSHSLLHLL